MTLTYSSNNSGGSWWLTDSDWLALERAGWQVEWYRNEPPGLFQKPDGRFLGALASNATLETNDVRQAILDWENLTNQSAAEQGCTCCGPPHNFSWVDEQGQFHYLETKTTSSWSID